MLGLGKHYLQLYLPKDVVSNGSYIAFHHSNENTLVRVIDEYAYVESIPNVNYLFNPYPNNLRKYYTWQMSEIPEYKDIFDRIKPETPEEFDKYKKMTYNFNLHAEHDKIKYQYENNNIDKMIRTSFDNVYYIFKYFIGPIPNITFPISASEIINLTCDHVSIEINGYGLRSRMNGLKSKIATAAGIFGKSSIDDFPDEEISNKLILHEKLLKLLSAMERIIT